MLAFLGASGHSVKIVCRGELLPDNGGGVPTEEADIERFQRIDSLAEMLSDLFRKPAANEKGTWWSTTDILSLLQRKYGKSTLKNITPEKIGNTLSRNDFRFESKHSNTGTKYLMIER